MSVTDANLCLGRIVPDYFPKIFGADKKSPLDKEAVNRAFELLAVDINKFCQSNNQSKMTIEEIAFGFVKVANEAMCRSIRAITQGKGYEISSHILTCFGGAGRFILF